MASNLPPADDRASETSGEAYDRTAEAGTSTMKIA
jgi:hypothetical protein